MIILDFETNSANIHDVIEVAAFRVKQAGNKYITVDTFHRYYFSRYNLNTYTLAIHKLSPERLEKLRTGVSYSEYFEDDLDFIEFCKDAETLVAHNISFELRHIGDLVVFKNHFCTMKENRDIIQATNIAGNLKNPKLIEACDYYNIEFDNKRYHNAIYDVTKTLEVLNKMKIR